MKIRYNAVMLNELKRAFFGKGMVLAIIIGLGIVFWHQVQYVWNPNHGISNGLCMESAYYNWIGGSSAPMQSFLFYFLIPLLAVLPSECTFYEDLKSGFLDQLSIRGARTNYLKCKYIATFLSGGAVVGVCLFISFLLTAMKFPLLLPEPIKGVGPDFQSFDLCMFYQHPFIHTLFFIVIGVVFAGGSATIALAITYWLNHRFSIMIAPFVVYYFLFSLDQLIGETDYAPNYFLIAGFAPHLLVEFAVGVVVIVILFLIYYLKGRTVE